jgi:hypothetical protein
MDGRDAQRHYRRAIGEFARQFGKAHRTLTVRPATNVQEFRSWVVVMTGKRWIFGVSLLLCGTVAAGAGSGAHNPAGEDSKGLFQINASAKPAGKGQDLSPWTTTHATNGSRSLRPSFHIRPMTGFSVRMR